MIRDLIRSKLEGLPERNMERQEKRRRCLSEHLKRRSEGRSRQYEKSVRIPKKRDRLPKELTAQERRMNQLAEESLDRKDRGINRERDHRIMMPEPPLPKDPYQ